MPDDSPTPNYRYISRPRRTREDRRFITGRGSFVQDVQHPNTKHIALVASPYPRARILSIDTGAALAMDGVLDVITGAELAEHTDRLYHGVDLPGVRWHPLALGMTRYAGEWVAAVVADSRYIAEDAAELVVVEYEPLEPAIGIERVMQPDAPLVHPDHGSNILLKKTFTWGPVAEDFAAAEHTISYRARWGRSSAVPIETFGVVSRWSEKDEMLEVWASIQMPQYQEQIADALRIPLNAVRVHNYIDVGGSYGVKRGIKQTVLTGYASRKLGVPVRLIEDRIDNMTGGDAHGPDRLFDITMAYDGDGIVRSMKMRVVDDVGAYPGRSIQQLGKPISALCGPYRMKSIEYDVTSVTSNKTSQVAVRGFGQAPTNFAVEMGIEKIARTLGVDRLELRRRNFIRHDEFPWKIPSGTKYDSGDYHTVLDKVLKFAGWEALVARRDAMRAEGRLVGLGIATCLEPGGGNNIFEHLLNEKIQITTFVESALLKIDGQGQITVGISTHTAGQGHQTLAATVAGEELERDPDGIRVVHLDSLEALPTRGPVASRMAIMLGTAVSKAARRLRDRMIHIAAHDLGVADADIDYADGEFAVRGAPARKLGWNEVVFIAHRQLHRMPPDTEPGLQTIEVHAVPGGGRLPNEKGEVQIYPCFSFQAHVPLVEIDRVTGRVEILDYAVAHDCGTVINPHIVRGMMMGGIAHGIGAALYEKFDYTDDGQLLSGTFLDYLLPSAHEIPAIRDTEHCTPSPLTSHGQKGSGEGGYLGAPAAVNSAVNDALAPLGIALQELPMRLSAVEDALHRHAAAPSPTKPEDAS
ncbi:MAG: xanthine dehydrogenase family protein molybdopterin-binding subunit [Proteobacteria bacterium]|nr:xanthine dehydrogenase family protein molybdopterin-binding subunit [Pseudomonadota bacterium]